MKDTTSTTSATSRAVLQAAEKYGPMGLQTVFVSMDDNRFRQRKIDESAMLGLKIAMPLLSICAPGKCLSGIKNLGNFGRLYAFPTAVVIDQFGVTSVKLMSGSGVRDGLDGAAKKVMQSAGLLPASR